MSTDFDLDRFLARIGFQGTAKPDLPTLAAIHAAQVDTIAFEGLDALVGRPIKLDLKSVQDKLVNSRRGGYCHEQNVLLKAALEAIGFKVTSHGGRVRWMSQPDSPLGPREHTLLKVDLPEGPYLADVGFGACLLDRPLRLDLDTEKRTAMGTYRLTKADGLFWLSAKQPDDWRMMYAFDLEPHLHSDIELANWYTSTSPLVPFTSMVIMERLTSDKRYKLINRRFAIEARDGKVAEERTISSADELGQVLNETFGVTPAAPIEEIFARTGG
jgi:N-hydroxyarylamine O-acetyltransferase